LRRKADDADRYRSVAAALAGRRRFQTVVPTDKGFADIESVHHAGQRSGAALVERSDYKLRHNARIRNLRGSAASDAPYPEIPVRKKADGQSRPSPERQAESFAGSSRSQAPVEVRSQSSFKISSREPIKHYQYNNLCCPSRFPNNSGPITFCASLCLRGDLIGSNHVL